MKKLCIVLCLMVCLSCFVATQPKDLNQQFDDLMKICEERNYEKASQYIAYKGDDETRNWKDVCNYQNDREKERVDEFVNDIIEIQGVSNNYEIVDRMIETESEGDWYILKVDFSKGAETYTIHFAFLNINGRYVLGDID